MTPEPTRLFLRHILATIAYRGTRAIQNAPDTFATFQIGLKSRRPVEILAHIGDLMEWALSMAQGAQKWQNVPPQEWKQEVTRFYTTIKQFDEFLASPGEVQCSLERLFQGPIADSLTHIGQIGMLRRLAGSPLSNENFFVADVAVGKVGFEQGPPKQPF